MIDSAAVALVYSRNIEIQRFKMRQRLARMVRVGEAQVIHRKERAHADVSALKVSRIGRAGEGVEPLAVGVETLEHVRESLQQLRALELLHCVARMPTPLQQRLQIAVRNTLPEFMKAFAARQERLLGYGERRRLGEPAQFRLVAPLVCLEVSARQVDNIGCRLGRADRAAENFEMVAESQ